jgi:hypothetical protein
MGTSRDYIPPTANAWRPDKRQLDKIPSVGSIPKTQLGGLLKAYIKGNGNGGPSAMAGRGGGGAATSQSGLQAAARMAAFLSGISARGLDATLKTFGFSNLIGKTASEILQVLLDSFTDASITGDDEDARKALIEIWDQILGKSQTYKEVDDALSTISDEASLSNMLMSFYGFYIFEQFWRVEFKIISDKVGNQKAEHLLVEMKAFIKEELRDHICALGKPITSIDWLGSEGTVICRQVMERTLYVFCPEEE